MFQIEEKEHETRWIEISRKKHPRTCRIERSVNEDNVHNHAHHEANGKRPTRRWKKNPAVKPSSKTIR